MDVVFINKFINVISIVGVRGLVKVSYFYIDFDIGVNFRNKLNIFDFLLLNRFYIRLNSVDFFLNNKDLEFYIIS